VGWLSAEKLSEELAPMISSNGRLTALTTTNRIEAMDAAINLLDVATVLERERSMVSREALAPEFKLRYLPAAEAKLMLESFLGVKKESSGPLTPQQIQMMQQQQQQRNQGGAAPTAQKKVEISIVANVRQNSIIIRAPLDRVAVATEFLKRVDVPSDTMASLADIQSSMQVFRLASLDPEKLIEIITEMNILEPTTRIRADDDNNALIVSGSAADRFIITSLIERLDGSGREFHVLQLRRLSATEVAESISFLMGQEKKEDDSSSRRSRYYGYYGYGSNEEEKKETDEFRVAANERYRQVLLWANDSEMAQVESLLIKLGEIPPPGGSQRTLRMVDASATPETYEYLLRLQQQWKATAENQLQLPDQSEFKDPVKRDEADARSDDPDADAEKDAGAERDAGAEKKADGDNEDGDDSTDENLAPASTEPDETVRAENPFRGYLVKTMQSDTENDLPTESHSAVESHSAAETDTKAERSEQGSIRSSKDFDRFFGDKPSEPAKRDNPERPKSPIRIELDAQGNLLLLSSDTKALDQLENLMMQVKPPRRPYHVFKIQYASSFWIKWNLEEYYESDEEGDSEADQLYRWWYDIDEDDDDTPAGLAKGNSLRFVEDPDTNTIVVSGATNEQLRTIEELIELWDVEEPVNKRRMRFTRLVSLKYGKAEPIAETVKEAYRDLLSSNDKSFSGRGGGQRGGENQAADAPRKREGNGSGLMDRENGNEGDGADFSFKGKLSIGIDSVGNTLLVSAEGEGLLDLVTGMIDKLDMAARSAGEVGIFQLSGDVSSQSIERALKAFGATPTGESMPQRRSADPDGDE
ncbi:MAG: hypothetical protein HKN47_23905, partial [Pirellulaceae bacterium]|nr:hypothetical protein [Pirellulaceae bacterium]